MTSLKSRKETRACEQCGDEFQETVWIRKDGTELADRLCPKCEKARATEEEIATFTAELEERRTQIRGRWKAQSGVSGIFLTKSFENFKRDLQTRAFDAISSPKPGSLVLLSPNLYGLGKTHLVSALANHLLATTEPAYFETHSYYIVANPCPVHLTTEAAMLARIRNTYNRGEEGGETEEAIFHQLIHVPLLIIDDVGKVQPRDLSFLQGVYYRIIDARYIHERRVILTSNLTAQELEAHIGGACADRLREMCGKAGFVIMRGTSYRKV